jgi:O-antigen/teichoic acid export membrane protein
MSEPDMPTSTPKTGANLTSTAFSALKWNYVGTVAKSGANFAVGIILARLLGPIPYGQVAVASLVISFGGLVADVGLGAALIQKQELDKEDIRFAFTVQMLFAAFVVGAIWLLTHQIAGFFHQPETELVIRTLVPIFILQALGQTATSLLARNLHQKKIQTIQLISYLVGYVGFGIPMAIFGTGVWSLVAAQLAQTLLNTALVYASVRHSVLPLLTSKNARLLRYGGKVAGTNLVNWWISSSDNLFVGRTFGAADLGLYNRSFMLVYMPAYSLVSTLQAVLFSAYSRSQGRPKSLQQTYLASVAIIAMLTMPPFFVVAVIPDAVISGIYGPRWMGAVSVLIPLALAMSLDALTGLAGPVMWGLGKVERELWPQLVTAVSMVAMMMLMSRISFVAVGWGVLMIYLLRFALMTRSVLVTMDLDWIDIGRALRAAAVVTFLTALIAWGTDRLLLARVSSMSLHLSIDILISVASYGLLLIASSSFWTQETRWFFAQIAPNSRALASVLAFISREPSLPGSSQGGD